MKRIIILFCFLLFSKVLIGQVNSNQSDVFLFVKGNLLQNLVCEDLELDEIIDSKDRIEEETDLAYNIKVTILEKAIKFYEELIDNYPNSKLLLRTLNNKGFAELELNDKENAKLTFLKILNSKEDENEKCEIPWIIQKPYLDFKNKASKALANIYIKDSNYTEAIKYLDLAMKYPFNHFCNFEYNSEQNYIKYLYAKCKFGIDKKSALKEFLPKLFQVDIEDNSELYLLIYNTLLQQYSNEDLKINYEKAYKNYKIEKVKNNEFKYENYFITFIDTKIELYLPKFKNLNPKEKAKQLDWCYRNSKFYILLNKF